MIRISVRSASPFARAGLEQALAADPRFEVLRPGSPDESDDTPDVIIVDGSADEIPKSLPVSNADPAPRFVLLADAFDPADLARLIPLGVRSVLPRDSTSPEIAAAIEAVALDLVALTSELLESLLPADRQESETEDLQEPLTAREMEVLTLLADGAGNKEIAAKLGISENTAKFHVSSILGKLGATTRTEAVSRGYRLGLILI
ncbi:MAG TPA: response regulator transcription factor [Terracidiphilus sp.]